MWMSRRKWLRLDTETSDRILELAIEDDDEKMSEILNGLEHPNAHLFFSGKNLTLFDQAPPIISLLAFLKAVKCLRVIMGLDPDLKELDERGLSVFYYAVAGGSVEIVKMFMECEDKPLSFLETAARFGSLDVIKYFSLQVDPVSIGLYLHDSFFRACSNGHLQVAEFIFELMSESKIDNKRIILESLNSACSFGQADIVEYLLNQGASLIDFTSFHKEHPLLLAIKGGYLQVVKVFHSHGLDLLDVNGQTFAISAAVSSGHIDIVNYLCNNCPGAREALRSDPSLFKVACLNGDVRMMRFLYSKRCVVANSDLYLSAIQSKNLEVAVFLRDVVHHTPKKSKIDAKMIINAIGNCGIPEFFNFYKREDVAINLKTSKELLCEEYEEVLDYMIEHDLVVFPSGSHTMRNVPVSFFLGCNESLIRKICERGIKFRAVDFEDYESMDATKKMSEEHLNLIIDNVMDIEDFAASVLYYVYNKIFMPRDSIIILKLKVFFKWLIQSGMIYNLQFDFNNQMPSSHANRLFLDWGLDLKKIPRELPKDTKKRKVRITLKFLLRSERYYPYILIRLAEQGLFDLPNENRDLIGFIQSCLLNKGVQFWFNFLCLCKDNPNFPKDGFRRLRKEYFIKCL